MERPQRDLMLRTAAGMAIAMAEDDQAGYTALFENARESISQFIPGAIFVILDFAVRIASEGEATPVTVLREYLEALREREAEDPY